MSPPEPILQLSSAPFCVVSIWRDTNQCNDMVLPNENKVSSYGLKSHITTKVVSAQQQQQQQQQQQ